jgi:hypothetical protein
VFKQVSHATSILNSILEGTNDFPQLFVIVPIAKNSSLCGQKDKVGSWRQAVDAFFKDPKLIFADNLSIRLYPLCAYSMEPVGAGVEILHPSVQMQEMSFALQMGAAVLSSIALSSYPLAMLVPGFDSSVNASLHYVTALRAALTGEWESGCG